MFTSVLQRTSTLGKRKSLFAVFAFICFTLSSICVHPDFGTISARNLSWLIYILGITILSCLSLLNQPHLNKSFYIRISTICIFFLYLLIRGADVDVALIFGTLLLGLLSINTLAITVNSICLTLFVSSAILAIRILAHQIIDPHLQLFECANEITIISLTLSLRILSASELIRTYENKVFKGFLIIASVVEFLIIYFINSRIGMICCAIVCINYIPNKIVKSGCILIISCVFILSNISTIKINSTLGRIFILNTSLKLIDSPQKVLIGLGDNGFDEMYMIRQADELENRDISIRQLASNITHPLNEFVFFYIKYGLIGLFLLLITLFLAVFNRSRVIKLFVLIITIFAFFSYPLYYPIPYIVLTYALSDKCIDNSKINSKITGLFKTIIFVLLGTMIITVICQSYSYWNWQKAYLYSRIGFYDKATTHYDRASRFLNSSYFYYNQSHFELKKGCYQKSSEIINKCLKNDYNVSLFKASLYKSMGKYNEALSEYTLANRMCPSRFLPIYEQYLIFESLGDTINMIRIREDIRTKPVKIETVEINQIKNYILNNSL